MILVREEDFLRADNKRKRLLASYIVIACLFVAAALLLLFLSPDEYVPYMVGTILLSVTFGFYSIFFFSVWFDAVKKRSKILDKVLSALPEREYGVYIKELDVMTYEGVEMRTLRFSILGDERNVHYLQGDFPLVQGETYEIEIRAGVLYEIVSMRKDEKTFS